VTQISSRYATPAAFRRAVEDRLKREAKNRSRPVNELRREFLLQRFLARVFHDPNGPWVLKGGAGLLIRLPGARYSRDVDLLHVAASPATAVQELRGIAQLDLGDHLRLVIDKERAMTGAAGGVSLYVDAYTGVTRYDRFSIDLSTDQHFVAHVDRCRPDAVVVVPGVPALPKFTLYPLPDQVADKVCAMFGHYGSELGPSNRYRDLVDLVFIATRCSLDATLTLAALRSEERRRGMTLPLELHAPGPGWIAGYPATARGSTLDTALHDLAAALQVVGTCLNPLLAGDGSLGEWNPDRRAWEQRPGQYT